MRYYHDAYLPSPAMTRFTFAPYRPRAKATASIPAHIPEGWAEHAAIDDSYINAQSYSMRARLTCTART